MENEDAGMTGEYTETQPLPYTGQPWQGQEGSLRYQIDSSDIVEEIERSLRGEVLMSDGHGGFVYKVPDGCKPLINEKGINSILTILRSRLTKIFILSDLDQDQIEQITISIGRNIIDNLYYNWDLYDIQDDAGASTILSLVTDSVYATLRKGYMGNYLKFLRTTHQISEVQSRTLRDTPSPSSGGDDGVLGRLLGKKRR